MRIEQASPEEAKQIAEIVAKTIEEIYPRYYSEEIVRFFLKLHGQEAILSDITKGSVWTAKKDGAIIGTGSFQENHITRVYILPQYQGRGYGRRMMDFLEKEIRKRFQTAQLDASLPASIFYEKRGYRPICHGQCKAENKAVLVYEMMEKKLGK